MQTIFRTILKSNFVTLPNSTVRDKRVSFKARGILAMVLSQSGEWEVTQKWLETMGIEGREAIRSAMDELKEFGYAQFHREKDDKGVFVRAIWTFCDLPCDGNPSAGLPSAGLPSHIEEQGNKTISRTPKPPRGDVAKNLPTSDFAKRFARIFNRALTTPWSEKEIKSFKKLKTTSEDLALVEIYYKFERKKHENICRRDLLTLLNNFPGEVDRARSWSEKNQKIMNRSGHAAPKRSTQEPEGFRKWLAEEYPKADQTLPWSAYPDDIKGKFSIGK